MGSKDEILKRMETHFKTAMDKAMYDVMDEATLREQDFDSTLEAAAFVSNRLSQMAGKIALEAVAEELASLK